MLQEAVSFSPDDPDKQVQAGGTADGVGGHVPAAKDIEDDGKGKQNQETLAGDGAGGSAWMTRGMNGRPIMTAPFI